jgi:hypothetical protein
MQSRALTLGARAALASAAFVQQRAGAPSATARRSAASWRSMACACITSIGPRHAARHAAWQRQHAPGVAAERPLPARRGALSRESFPIVPGTATARGPAEKWWGPRAQSRAAARVCSRGSAWSARSVFGHSFGALVALAYALDYPAETRGVVLASGYYFPTARLDVPFMASPAFRSSAT